MLDDDGKFTRIKNIHPADKTVRHTLPQRERNLSHWFGRKLPTSVAVFSQKQTNIRLFPKKVTILVIHKYEFN